MNFILYIYMNNILVYIFCICLSVDVIDFHVKYGIYMHGDAET